MSEALKNIPTNSLDFKAFCHYLEKSSGITITPSKTYLVEARIRNIMIDYEFSHLADLVCALNDSNKDLHQRVINAMTTNETFWFRDDYPFLYFHNNLLPLWCSRDYTDSEVRVWSAACSSGQEPYSLGILCEEYRKKHIFNQPITILATDLSGDILQQAISGSYDQLSIGRGLSSQRLDNFFDASYDNQWTVNDRVKKYVQFKPINLLESYASLGKFDVIFCRNVLIYFTQETKVDILTRMHACLKPKGLLCLGSSESLSDASALFSMLHCKPGIIYQAR